MIERKFKPGTPIRDRVEPQLQERGYDTSTLKVVRFGGGSYYEIVLDDRIVGGYTARADKLVMHDETK